MVYTFLYTIKKYLVKCTDFKGSHKKRKVGEPKDLSKKNALCSPVVLRSKTNFVKKRKPTPLRVGEDDLFYTEENLGKVFEYLNTILEWSK